MAKNKNRRSRRRMAQKQQQPADDPILSQSDAIRHAVCIAQYAAMAALVIVLNTEWTVNPLVELKKDAMKEYSKNGNISITVQFEEQTYTIEIQSNRIEIQSNSIIWDLIWELANKTGIIDRRFELNIDGVRIKRDDYDKTFRNISTLFLWNNVTKEITQREIVFSTTTISQEIYYYLKTRFNPAIHPKDVLYPAVVKQLNQNTDCPNCKKRLTFLDYCLRNVTSECSHTQCPKNYLGNQYSGVYSQHRTTLIEMKRNSIDPDTITF